jgi:FKBP-type peptidyl-prolyl cis-trans isomerase
MKLKSFLMISMVMIATQASAEETVVIDSEMLGEQPGAVATEPNTTAPLEAGAVSQADANRERLLKGGKISARQKTAMAKAKISDNNKQQGEIFLAENKAKQGVISLPSGVQYKILRAGSGKPPKESSVVTCRLRGTLIDGATFDKSDLKKPVALSVSGLLPGLKEAVMLMSSGAKWQIVIPSQLAYGELGDRGIGPNAVLIYDMEIIKIK